MRWLSPARLAVGGLFLLGAAAFLLWLAPASGYDIRLVDPAHPVDPVIRVPDEKASDEPGSIYFVDVREREARLLERLLPWVRPNGSSVVEAPQISSTVERPIGRQGMSAAQKGAAVVAPTPPRYEGRAASNCGHVLVVAH